MVDFSTGDFNLKVGSLNLKIGLALAAGNLPPSPAAGADVGGVYRSAPHAQPPEVETT